ncbi:Hemolysin [Pseudomonas sp. R4-39-08]|nr:Hemolysin [Pseudomonas sp. R4-39-08]
MSLGSGFVKVPLKIGLKDGLNKKDSMFGVTVHSFDNNKFMFGKAEPYGAALGAHPKSVADKGYTFYEVASGEKK